MDKMARDTITTIVEPMSSSLVDHDTLPISSLTSLKKPTSLFVIAIFTYRFLCLTPYLYILIGLSTLRRCSGLMLSRAETHQYGIKVAGAGGIEPPVTVLETVGLPLTDAPNTRTPALQQDFFAPISFPYAACASCKTCKTCSAATCPDSASCSCLNDNFYSYILCIQR